MYRIQTLNHIAVAGLERLPRDRFEVASSITDPDAIVLRSYSMHGMTLPASLKAVGRAGVGVNNIPVEALTADGIPVFNAPGANSNAVKELVLAGMLMAARDVCAAWQFVQGLQADERLEAAVEDGKKRFRGFELPGRTLGVMGLGAIGVQVANAALGLGMRVVGYDPDISVHRAWQLASSVRQATSVGDLLTHSDFVSLHVPLTDATRHLVNRDRLARMRPATTLLNFSRAGIVDEEALAEALDAGRIHAYVSDFPSPRLHRHPRVLALPHIGASTREAEDNCAIMVVEQIVDYLEHGVVRNSVNFPDMSMPPTEGHRVVVVNRNVPNMLGQISTCLASADLNILDMLNRSRGNVACTLLDVDRGPSAEVMAALADIDGVLSVRCP